ncbi:MAG: HAD family hydrolase [Bacillota bacterium]
MQNALILDMDGTIFQSSSVVLKAFRRTFAQLAASGLHRGPVPSDAEFLSTMGKIIPEIWRQLLPEQPAAIREHASRLMRVNEDELFERKEGRLFPEARETLQTLLAEGWTLYVASNGTLSYLESIVKHTGISALFSGIYASTDLKLQNKTELVNLIIAENRIDPVKSALIGDRSYDVETGKAAGLKVIGCAFGYGSPSELEGSDIIVSGFAEIPAALCSLGLAESV